MLADQQVVVDEAIDGLAVVTASVGNSVAAHTQGQDLSFGSEQLLAGSVAAQSYTLARGQGGEVYVTSASATGNTGDASACCGHLSADVAQTVAGHTNVSAANESRAGGQVAYATGSATAIGNSQGYSAVNGSVGARTVQSHYGTTNAYNQAVFCCIVGAGQFASTAVANNVTSQIEGGPAYHAVDQLVDGYETRATNDVYAVTGNEVTGVATASANIINSDNTGGASELFADQTNQSLVEAESMVQLENWYGTGSSVAYGVGNSISLSSVSTDVFMDTRQRNNGDVNAYATFNGGAGEDVFTSSTAIGNAVSGYACSECRGVFNASNYQENNGTVRSVSRTTAGHAHFVTGTATAVGNSASYESYRGN